MKIKCGRIEYELNEKDIIFFNGACYMLITRKIVGEWGRKHSPTVAIAKAKKLIKDGLLKEVKLSNPPYSGENYKYYKINEA